MTAPRLNVVAALRREIAARAAPIVPHWRDRRWVYQGAATHSDSTAFRARQIARGMPTKDTTTT